jgi:ribosomal protein L11 methyltransferase
VASYPAVYVASADPDFLLAVLDEFSPVAVEEHDHVITIFFADAALRDQALAALALALPDARGTPRDVDDEDWARRSQENLGAVTVELITVAPPWAIPPREPADAHPLIIVIQPSMGFGTGHHATTRLCLRALQQVRLESTFVLDVGTGSGVLALAARALGANEAIGIDMDADAVRSARENLLLNPHLDHVTFEVCDLAAWRVGVAAQAPARKPNLVLANLTASGLIRSADSLLRSVAPAGSLIVSGFSAEDRPEVIAAYTGRKPAWQSQEDGWQAILLTA